jgi:hypothetical protein
MWQDRYDLEHAVLIVAGESSFVRALVTGMFELPLIGGDMKGTMYALC